MLGASASLRSFTNDNGAEVNELLDSDDDGEIEILPTPKARRSGLRGGYEAPTFASLHDDGDGGNTEREDSDNDSLLDLANASQVALNRNHSMVCSLLPLVYLGWDYTDLPQLFQSASRAASTLSTSYERRSTSTVAASISCVKRKPTHEISDHYNEDELDTLPKKKRAKKDPEQARLEKVRVTPVATPCPRFHQLAQTTGRESPSQASLCRGEEARQGGSCGEEEAEQS